MVSYFCLYICTLINLYKLPYGLILFSGKKIGGSRVHTLFLNQFSDFLNQASLFSLPCSGTMYTWCNNNDTATRIYERLDRGLANANWLQLFPNYSLINMPIHGSEIMVQLV